MNGVKFVAYKRDIRRKTQNSGVFVHGLQNEEYYGVLEEIFQLSYLNGNFVVLFKCRWFDNRKIKRYKNRTSIFVKDLRYETEPFILANQAKQVFYLDDLFNGPNWKVVEHFSHRHIWDIPEDALDVQPPIDQDNVSSTFNLTVEEPNIDTMTFNRADVEADVVVTSTIDQITELPVDDDFINDDIELIDETLEDYAEAELSESDDNEDSDLDIILDINSSDDE